jgi:hypothetical protein
VIKSVVFPCKKKVAYIIASLQIFYIRDSFISITMFYPFRKLSVRCGELSVKRGEAEKNCAEVAGSRNEFNGFFAEANASCGYF